MTYVASFGILRNRSTAFSCHSERGSRSLAPLLLLLLYEYRFVNCHSFRLQVSGYNSAATPDLLYSVLGVPVGPMSGSFWSVPRFDQQPATMILEKVRNQQVYITLLGPRNETLTGQLNMTDLQSLSRTGPRDAGAGEPKDGPPVPGTSTPKFYDSRGAAYYICVFILVYALAIVMFVASLARRRRSSYQNGEFSRLPKSDILYYYNTADGGLSSARDTTSAAAEARYSFVKDDIPAAAAAGATRQGNTTLRFQKPCRASRATVDMTRGVNETGLDKRCSLPDELITLVQVLPCTEIDTNPEASYWDDGSASDDTLRRHALSMHEQKCRWSIGPDGNLFILQVDGNDSSRKFCLEEGQDQSLVVKNSVTCKEDLRNTSDKSEIDGPSSKTRTIDRDDVTASNSDCYKNTSVSDDRRNSMPCAEKATMEYGHMTNPPEGVLTTCTKCDSMSLAEHDGIITDNNYNCDFENPWGLPTYPEIQKLIHVTSV